MITPLETLNMISFYKIMAKQTYVANAEHLVQAVFFHLRRNQADKI